MRRTLFLALGLILAILFPVTQLRGQSSYFNQDYDSLTKQLNDKRSDRERIDLLKQLIDLNPEFSMVPGAAVCAYLDELARLNKKTAAIDGAPYELMQAGYDKWKRGDLEGALTKCKESVDAFDRQRKIISPFLTQVRVLFNRLNRQNDRFQYYKTFLDRYLVNGPVENTAACYHGMGGYYVYKADYNLAISNYLKAARVYRTFDTHFYYNELGVIGVYYAMWGNDEKADFYLTQAIPQHKKLRDSTNVAYCLSPLIKLNTRQGHYERALAYADEAIRFSNKDENDAAYAIATLDKAFVYLAMKKPAAAAPYLAQVDSLVEHFHLQVFSTGGYLENDFAFYQYYSLLGDQENASARLLIAYEKAVTAEARQAQLRYLKELGVFYQGAQPALAMRYMNRYFELTDSMQESSGSQKVAQFENEEKDREQLLRINSLKQEQAVQAATIRQRNIILWVSLGALLLIAASMLFLWRQLTINKRVLQTLRNTQAQLVHAEKMASLGELTAGIAHEIQNPLNFVNNFSELNTELIAELEEELGAGNSREAIAIAGTIRDNEEKIVHHGRRADSIVKGMLQHSRQNNGQKERTDLNALVDEFLRLSYHGLRAKDKAFNAQMETHLDPAVGKVSLFPQDIGRVLLNLFNNSFYSVQQKKILVENGYEPLLQVNTRRTAAGIEIVVKDNGTGIPQKVLGKIFQPFFTTKPTGEGTGLGLSMSYDIITKGHGGEMTVETIEGQGTEFIIRLPVVAVPVPA